MILNISPGQKPGFAYWRYIQELFSKYALIRDVRYRPAILGHAEKRDE